MSKVITANMLATGRVVFFGPGDTWVDAVEQAVGFADDKAAGEALARAQLDQDRALVVEPFITERGTLDGAVRPAMSLRDTIRAYGPTVRFSGPAQGG